MSILDDVINLDMSIINHTCKLYIKKYGINTQEGINDNSIPCVDDILHEYDSIDNLDKIFVYWTYAEWDGCPFPTYNLLITDIAPKLVEGQRDVLVRASILMRDDSFYRSCTNRGHLLSLSDIMNELNN
jgi:hypothetical protein